MLWLAARSLGLTNGAASAARSFGGLLEMLLPQAESARAGLQRPQGLIGGFPLALAHALVLSQYLSSGTSREPFLEG